MLFGPRADPAAPAHDDGRERGDRRPHHRPADVGEAASKGKNVIVVADLDIFGDQFFVLNERGGDLDGDGIDDLRFDNVPFLLNAIDTLTGDAGASRAARAQGAVPPP